MRVVDALGFGWQGFALSWSRCRIDEVVVSVGEFGDKVMEIKNVLSYSAGIHDE